MVKSTLKQTLGCACIILFLVQCNAPKKVKFEDPVNTKDKAITRQQKKTYSFDQPKVWISNEFDGARLNNAEQLNDSVIEVQINPENTPINKSPYFAFKVWSDHPRTLYIKFRYPEGFTHRYVPKIKSQGNWQRADSIQFQSTEESALLQLNIDNEPKIIAAQEINSTADVKEWYSQNIINGNENIVHEFSAGTSVLGKNLPVLDIYSGNPEDKPLVILMTRQHPPEVTGYFAYQHFLETIVSGTPLSKEFLENHRVLAFPILNPDGVDMGHWRHNANGIDLNRDWAKYRQAEIRQVVSYITKISKQDNNKIVLGMDFHSTYEDVFYTNQLRNTTTLPNFENDWFALLEKEISGYKVNEAAGNSTKPVSKGWFLYGQNATGITYEIGDDTPRERIAEIGEQSANAMMHILLGRSH